MKHKHDDDDEPPTAAAPVTPRPKPTPWTPMAEALAKLRDRINTNAATCAA